MENIGIIIYHVHQDSGCMLDIQKVKGFLMAPTATFRASKGDSLGSAFRYYAILLVIWTVLAAIVTTVMGYIAFQDALIRLASTGILGTLLARALANFSGFISTVSLFVVFTMFLVALVGVFISGFLWHVFVLLFGGKKDIEQTIKTLMYAATPTLLLGWIPGVAIIGYIWSLALMILGLPETQEMTIGESILVVVVPLVLLLIWVMLGSAVAAALIAGITGMLTI
jgi:hypothetical protein